MMGPAAQLPDIRRIRLERIRLDQPFELAAARFAGEEGTVLLLSGSDQDCARYHILGVWPLLTLASRGNRICVKTAGGLTENEGDPFECLREVMARYAFEDIPEALPMAGGCWGIFPTTSKTG